MRYPVKIANLISYTIEFNLPNIYFAIKNMFSLHTFIFNGKANKKTCIPFKKNAAFGEVSQTCTVEEKAMHFQKHCTS